MGHIFVIIGKSATGKDTLFARIMKESGLRLSNYVSYTTRPMRENEKDGREYFFRTVDEYKAVLKEGKIIESRVYHTVYGDWFYYTADDGQIDLKSNDYLTILTLEGFLGVKKYYDEKGLEGTVIPLYIEITDRERIGRALAREDLQEVPKIKEMCRRFLADDSDFSEEKIAEAGIVKRFSNMDSDQCYKELTEEIRKTVSAN